MSGGEGGKEGRGGKEGGGVAVGVEVGKRKPRWEGLQKVSSKSV